MAPGGLTTTMRLLSTKTHATLFRKWFSTSHRHVGWFHTKTHVKKYTIFSCNKMAVSDRRPFSLSFAEEETTVLYTAIPNSTNSKSVAAKHEGYSLTYIVTSGWDTPGSQWAHRFPPPLTVIHPWFRGGGFFPGIGFRGGGVFPGITGWCAGKDGGWTALSIMIQRNMPIEEMKRAPFTNATLRQSIRPV